MNDQNEQAYKDVIEKLTLLRTVKPDEQFTQRMQKKVAGYASPKPYAMPFFALRVAVIVFCVLLSGTGMVAAAHQSKPGDVLYPVKHVVDTVAISLSTETAISKAPTPLPQKAIEGNPRKQPTPQPTATPTVTETFQQTAPLQQAITPTSTPTAAATPTANPGKQGVLPAAQKAVEHALERVPAHVNLPIGGSSEPTPTPKPKHEGSKDNGSNAGAGGSLLPKIKTHP